MTREPPKGNEELIKRVFDAGFDEEWTVVQKHDRAEGHELNVINWENFAGPVGLYSSRPLRVWQMKMLLSFGYREGPLTRGS